MPQIVYHEGFFEKRLYFVKGKKQFEQKEHKCKWSFMSDWCSNRFLTFTILYLLVSR